MKFKICIFEYQVRHVTQKRMLWNKSLCSIKSRQKNQNMEQQTAKTISLIISEPFLYHHTISVMGRFACRQNVSSV
jgi:hypothetical protein